MCNRGNWDGIGTVRVYPTGEEDGASLREMLDTSFPAVVEQCSSCGAYRSVDARNIQFTKMEAVGTDESDGDDGRESVWDED
jgi:hypothetical protein